MMIDLINAARAEHGLPPLRSNLALYEAAMRHARDMANTPAIAANPAHYHIGSDGSTSHDRIRDAGYGAEQWQEAVGWGFDGDEGRMVDWWLNSPTHRDILLDPDLRDVGVGYVARAGTPWGHYWSVEFGRLADSPGPEKPPAPDCELDHVVYAPVVTGGSTYDLLPYLRGDGRMYEVRHPDGSTETFQTQTDGATFYQVKNRQWEEFYSDGQFIWRGVDTSPGNGRAYIQFEPGLKRARWCPRRMRVGQTWTGPGHTVQFKMKLDCSDSALNSGPATNRITLVAVHPVRVFNGIAIAHVAELTDGRETFWYGRGYGLVAWSSPWGQSSVIQLYAAGERPQLKRETMECFN